MFKKSPMIAAYIDLTKPRILTLVLVTTTLGFFLGGRGIHSFIELFFLLLFQIRVLQEKNKAAHLI